MKEVNFLDRVPTYPGRVVLTPVPGQANTYDMVRADNPTVEGTPLDKATFDSVVNSRLTGRYYVPGIERSLQYNGPVVAANPIPTSGWVDRSTTKSTNGSYTAEASTTYIDGTEPSHSFDESTSTSWMANDINATLTLDVGTPIKVKKIKLLLYWTKTITNITTTLSGSNDKESWDTLLTLEEMASAATEYSLPTVGNYRYYRLSLSGTPDGRVGVTTWAITEYEVSVYQNDFTVGDYPSEWTEGQRTFVEIPSSANTLAVTLNTLNGITVDTILQPSKRYELRYTGSAFAAKEV